MLQPGNMIASRYRIQRLLGQGGMGTVYLAEDYQHGTSVAIKVVVLKPGGSQLRLKREFRLMARFDHPYILKAYDSGAYDGTPYLVMEYLRGGTLEDKFAQPVSSRDDLLERLRFLSEVSEALSYIHSQGIVHRDLKPDNVMIADDHARLMDFGLARSYGDTTAKITQVGVVMGTAAYMSPEQARGVRVDARSDLYALGCMIYWMMTGLPPFSGQSFIDLLMRQLRDTPPSLLELNSWVPVRLAEIAERLLAKAPEDRYSAADDVTNVLMQVRRDLQEEDGSSVSSGTLQPTISVTPSAIYDNRTPANLLNPPLIGRDGELAMLRRGITQPQIVTIEADKGLGLSSLLQSLRREAAQHDIQTMLLNFSNHTMLPLSAWHEAIQAWQNYDKTFFAQLESDIRTQLDPVFAQSKQGINRNAIPDDMSRLRFYDAVDIMMQQYHAKHGLIVIVEDLELADEASIGLLNYLLRAKTAENISFVLGYDSDNVHHEVLQTLQHIDSHNIRLEPFSETTMLDYIGALLGGDVEPRLQHYILERADGSPLFAKELLNDLLQAKHLTRRAGLWEWSRAHTRLPGSIDEVFGDRIDSLTRENEKILQAAATIGRRFDFETVMVLTDVDEDAILDALDEALRAKLIEESGTDMYSFVHPLLRDLLHSNLSPRRRRKYHQYLGDRLVDTKGKPEQIADHYAETRDPSQAFPYAIQAARNALQVFANDISETYYRMALAAMPDSYEDKAQIQLELGQLLDRIGKWDEAQLLYEQVQESEPLLGVALYSLGTLARKRSNLPLAEKLLQKAMEITPENTKIHSDLALINSLQGDFEVAEEILSSALSLEVAKANTIAIAERQVDLGKLEEYRSNYSRAIAWFETGLQSINTLDVPHLTAILLNRKGVSNYRLGKLREAYADLQKAYELFKKVGDFHQGLVVLINQGGVLMDSDETDEAIAIYQKAAIQSFRLGDIFHEAACNANLGSLLIQKGKYEAAIRTLLDVESKLASNTSVIHFRVRIKANLAESYIANQQPQRALEEIGEARNILSTSEYPELELDLKNREVKAFFATNKLKKAESELTRVLAQHKDAEYRLILLDSYLLLCIANFVNGNLEAYVAHQHICSQLAQEIHDEVAEWQIGYLQAIVDGDIPLSERYKRKISKTAEHLFISHVHNALTHA